MKPLTMHTADIPTRDSRGRTVIETRPVYAKNEADARFAELEAERDAARADQRQSIHRAVCAALDEAGVENEALRGMCIVAALDAAIDAARSKP